MKFHRLLNLCVCMCPHTCARHSTSTLCTLSHYFFSLLKSANINITDKGTKVMTKMTQLVSQPRSEALFSCPISHATREPSSPKPPLPCTRHSILDDCYKGNFPQALLHYTDWLIRGSSEPAVGLWLIKFVFLWLAV